MTATQTAKARRAENAVQLLLMLGVGTVAGAASWAHVIHLAEHHGQGGWLAYADAAVIETAAVSAGLEMRRRKLTGQPGNAVTAVLFLAAGLQLAAQLAAAEKSVWGWLLGAVPAVFFLILVKIGLSRTATEREPMAGSMSAPTPATHPAIAEDTDRSPVTGQEPATEADTAALPEPAIEADTRVPTRRTPLRPNNRTSKRPANRTTGQDIARLRKQHPDITQADIAKRLGISERTVRRNLSSETDPATNVTPIHKEAQA